MNNVQKDGMAVARRYAEHLRTKGYPVVKVYLFGSFAKGKAAPDSDIDIAVVCKPFLLSRAQEAGRLFYETKDIDMRIEPVALHPEDLENRFSTIVQEVKRSGIIV
jgi:predicted nucleotidyltransferase